VRRQIYRSKGLSAKAGVFTVALGVWIWVETAFG